MTTNNKKNKKNSAARKLIPAIGMLTVSAMMLSSSTYAWFTMSREVEVNNIQMIATVPEDIQLSLGALTDGELNLDSGKLAATAKGTADSALTKVAVPAKDTDWSNTADIGKYYEFGRLIPASSVDGADIYFTPDADGVGKTVKTSAAYIKANGANDSASVSYQATAHTYQSKSGSTVTEDWVAAGSNPQYTKNTGWNTTNDDGYYVDIPVWFRTSSKDAVALQVTGYVVAGDTDANKVATSTTALDGVTEELRKAVRVAVLSSDASTSVSKIIDLKDAATGGSSIIDYYNRASVTDGAVKAAGTGASSTTYGSASRAASTDTIAVTAAAADNNGYGAATKYVIRVWLEGEDPDCWNATAGQDWRIALKFTNPAGDTVPAQGNGGNGGNG